MQGTLQLLAEITGDQPSRQDQEACLIQSSRPACTGWTP